MKRLLFSVCFMSIAYFATAQEFSFGFKVGLNPFTTIMGESEVDADGNALETMDNITGFHIGPMFNYSFNDYVGVRAELLFIQKGIRYKYTGTSFNNYTPATGNMLYSTGEKRTLLTINNNYLDVPLMVFVYPIKQIRIGAGINAGVLIGSSGNGEVTYSGTLTNGSNVEEHRIILSNDYGRDEAGEAKAASEVSFLAGSKNISLPSSIGAYYYETEKDGNYFNPFDFGLVGDIVYKLKGGLEFGARVNYGLNDVTNNFYDYAQFQSTGAPDYDRISRQDVDRNFSVQLSVGFGF